MHILASITIALVVLAILAGIGLVVWLVKEYWNDLGDSGKVNTILVFGAWGLIAELIYRHTTWEG